MQEVSLNLCQTIVNFFEKFRIDLGLGSEQGGVGVKRHGFLLEFSNGRYHTVKTNQLDWFTGGSSLLDSDHADVIYLLL